MKFIRDLYCVLVLVVGGGRDGVGGRCWWGLFEVDGGGVIYEIKLNVG